MSSALTEGVIVISHPQERETVTLIEKTYPAALQLAHEMWALDPAQDCHIYVMTSWWKFFFRSAPWPWKIMLAIGFPAWALRARRIWSYAAAWTQRYGHRVAIGVKPPYLIEKSDFRIGARMFIEEKDMRLKLQHICCHEIVHACSAHLNLPMWLNEGIATVTVDRFLRKRTIRTETLELLHDVQPKTPPPTYRQLAGMQIEAIVYHNTRSYWLTRYLQEQHTDFIKMILEKRRDSSEIDRRMAEELKINPPTFWREIDELLLRYFQSETNSA